MRVYIPIILILSMVFGFSGMALARKAQKKSSYPLLIISITFAVLTFLGIIAALVLIFFV